MAGADLSAFNKSRQSASSFAICDKAAGTYWAANRGLDALEPKLNERAINSESRMVAGESYFLS
jgi:hypothetical protein